MSRVPENLRYAKSHEWALVAEGIATIGITDHAQAELSDVVYVDLPKPGAKLTAGSTVAVIESVKAASDIYAPLSGEVLEINPALSAQPELVNKDPYGAAWLFRMRVAEPAELGAMLDPAAYRAQIGG